MYKCIGTITVNKFKKKKKKGREKSGRAPAVHKILGLFQTMHGEPIQEVRCSLKTQV